MQLTQQIKQAFTNILSAKLRSFLAVLGILVGTASVVALISIGELATQKALEQFKVLGTDLLAISFYESHPTAASNPANTFSLKEVRGLKDSTSKIREIAPYITIYTDMSYKGRQVTGSIIGATQALQNTIRISLKKGRFISFMDHYGYYCVIGNELYQKMKQSAQGKVLGSQIKLGKNYFTIVGVSAPWPENTFFNEDINHSVIIPIETTSVISKSSQIRNVIMRITPNVNIDQLQEHIKQYVNMHSPNLKVFSRSAKQLIKSMTNQHQIFTVLLGLIGGISLIVGGIGVMNVMLVTVAERRREIGIHMAIGARRKDIQNLFLIESIALSMFGGVMGVVVGILASIIISSIAHFGFGVFLLPPVIGFVVSVAVGIFFGYYPAYRASHLDPIETLRYE